MKKKYHQIISFIFFDYWQYDMSSSFSVSIDFEAPGGIVMFQQDGQPHTRVEMAITLQGSVDCII